MRIRKLKNRISFWIYSISHKFRSKHQGKVFVNMKNIKKCSWKKRNRKSKNSGRTFRSVWTMKSRWGRKFNRNLNKFQAMYPQWRVSDNNLFKLSTATSTILQKNHFKWVQSNRKRISSISAPPSISIGQRYRTGWNKATESIIHKLAYFWSRLKIINK